MTKNTLARPLKAALLGAVLSVPALTSSAFADTKNYQFQLVQQEAKVGDAVLAVRLVDKRSGKPVTDAVVFAKRLDMAPDAMEEMATKVEQVPSTEPGIYRFKAHLGMQGRWRLSLAAKVQGETGTVEDKLIIQAGK
ncbi:MULTISPECIES: FixH family protein [unclassified Methylobacterium]|uniref:FixH family protein n=1 Tax=Methylobacterium TaxID=407 RepID=UPI00034AF572|nr:MULTISPECIES: FixH family protein [unclassified Methylobacterium]MDH3030582.1 FixH family protein [Methylobacterium fujisawaense]WFS10419.1 FixH family protein [Methylobacterium sp. 391_Methyba4]SFV13890.1 YtkA-like [Methylobacterium sp. UNCCL125]